MMTQRCCLGLLEMGVARYHGGDVSFGELGQSQGQTTKPFDLCVSSATQIQAKIQGNLIVSGSAGVESVGRVADYLAETPLYRRMHIFVGLLEPELPVFCLGEDLIKAFLEVGGHIRFDDSGLAEHDDVGD
jgi:hypothetical protein